MMFKSTSPAVHTLTAAFFVSALALAAPSPASAQATTAPAADPMPAKHGAKATPLERADTRIATLHEKLHITDAQGAQWQEFAQVMRDNAKATGTLIKTRHENAKTMTAIDDMRSYHEIAQEHADGAKKLLKAFEPLYAAMSDEQKKNADAVFGHFEGRAPKQGK
jgi:protein CpxP